MLFLLLSIFGLIISDKFVYRLEMFDLIFVRIKRVVFVILNLPSVYFLYVKDHFIVFCIYIGLILLSLTFFNIYFELFLKKTFETAHIKVLEAINLNIKAGFSPFKSAEMTFKSLTKFEKIVFESLNHLQTDQKVPIYAQKNFTTWFFVELQTIINSQMRVSNQLDQFKKGLRVKESLRHRSRAAATQVRAQAVAAIFIYLTLMCFSLSELKLADYPEVIVISVLFFALGIFCIFFTGEKIKWTI